MRFLALSAVATLAAIGATLGTVAAAQGSSEKPAYCTIPSSSSSAWAFHFGEQIAGPSGSFAHGHGTFSGHDASGIICQVDRVRNSPPDRQVILKVSGPVLYFRHATTYDGSLANRLQMSVKVSSSTDSKCATGTKGTITLIATYDGAHHDEAVFAFPAACRDHDHTYTASSTATGSVLIPPALP